MPVPGVPTLDPVNLPSESPEQAGRGYGAVAQLGEETNDIAQTGLGFDLYLKKAQEHVDSLAAQNQLAKVYADTQNQLAKTQNSRDVEGIIQQSNKTLNDVSAQWSKSPAAINIQMSADALRPDLSRIGTVKQVDLMGKEFKITIDQQAETLSASYAADRAAGGNGDMALGAFATAVHGGVTTGLVGDAEGNEYVRRFKQKGQELQIRNGISNANPEVNQKTYDDISQHREQFPDVTQEQLDVMKGQALAAFTAHTKQQEWAQGQMAQNTMLRPLIQNHTNPGTGQFDEGSAMADIAKQFADGKITATQQDVLAEGVKAQATELQFGLKKEAGKRLDDVESMLKNHKFDEASALLEKNRDWFEQNGFSEDYRAALKYTDQEQREVRAEDASRRTEAHYAYAFNKQVEDENSQETLGQVQQWIASGHSLTKSDIYALSGTGKGKLKTRDVDAAWRMMDAYQKEPDFASAMKYINDNFAGKEDKQHPMTPDQIGAANKKYADTVDAFNAEVNANPTKSKAQIARDVVKSAQEQQIKDHADAMFGKAKGPGLMDTIKNFFSTASDAGLNANKTAAPAKPAGVPANYEWNPDGNNGKGSWRPPQSK